LKTISTKSGHSLALCQTDANREQGVFLVAMALPPAEKAPERTSDGKFAPGGQRGNKKALKHG
jgi:hypothetical protein